jgi:hypothetical protein
MFGKEEIAALKVTIKNLKADLKKATEVDWEAKYLDCKRKSNKKIEAHVKTIKTFEKDKDIIKLKKERHDTKLEILKLNNTIEEMTEEHEYTLKQNDRELDDLKKDATLEETYAKKELELAREAFEKQKDSMIKEAKREAAIEVKEQYVTMMDKVMALKVATSGVNVPTEVLELLKTK